MTKKKSILILIFTIFSITIGNAQKDTVPITDLFDLSLEELLSLEVTGVSRYTQKSEQIPSTIIAFNRQQIKEKGYINLSDLLKDIPGVDVIENAGRFGELYSFRGVSGNDRFLILINGHKLNPASGTFLSIGNSISISNANRVEIIYGPASAIYGADAFAGIINIVFDNSALDYYNFDVSGFASYGSMNSVDFGVGTAVLLKKDLLLNLNARVFKSDGFDVVGTDPVYQIINDYPPPIPQKCDQPINDHNLYAGVSYKDFSLNYYRQQFDQGNALGHSPLIYVFDKQNRWKTTTDIVWATYKKQFEEKGSLTIDVSYKAHIQDNNTAFHKWLSPNLPEGSFLQFMTGKDNTIQSVITYDQKISDKFQFITGIDFENTTSIPPYANDEVLGQPRKYFGKDKRIIDDQLTITENRSSAFGQFSYSPNKKFSFVVGARFDYSDSYKEVINPRAGLIFTPIESLSIKFNYGRAFQAPSLFFQYEQFSTPTITMLPSTDFQQTEPDFKLQNQIVNSYQLSISKKIGDNFQLKAIGYYNDLTNLIERKLFAAYPTDSVYNEFFDTYTSGLRNENIGEAKIIGGEFYFDAKIMEKLLINANYSYCHAVSKVEGGQEQEIPRVAPHKIRIGISVNELFKYFSISPQFSWNGSSYNANTNVYPDNRQESYSSLDVYLTVKNLNKHLELFANFNNLLDTKIRQPGLYTQMAVYTATIPQQGFNFNAGIKVFFRK